MLQCDGWGLQLNSIWLAKVPDPQTLLKEYDKSGIEIMPIYVDSHQVKIEKWAQSTYLEFVFTDSQLKILTLGIFQETHILVKYSDISDLIRVWNDIVLLHNTLKFSIKHHEKFMGRYRNKKAKRRYYVYRIHFQPSPDEHREQETHSHTHWQRLSRYIGILSNQLLSHSWRSFWISADLVNLTANIVFAKWENSTIPKIIN